MKINGNRVIQPVNNAVSNYKNNHEKVAINDALPLEATRALTYFQNLLFRSHLISVQRWSLLRLHSLEDATYNA